MNIKAYIPQIEKAIKEYGKEVTILRDTYTNEVGIKTLNETGKEITKLYILVDNSSNNKGDTIGDTLEGIERPTISAMAYYIYRDNLDILVGDYFILDGMRYILDIPVDLVHSNILYQVKIKGVIEDGR